MSNRASGSNVRMHLVLTLVTISWGFNNIAMKFGFQYFTAEQFSGVRLLMAFPFMLLLAFALPERVRFERRDLAGIVVIGLVGLGLFQVLFPIGIDETSASLGGILMATMPVYVVVLSLVFRLEKPRGKSIAGILLTLVGLAVITLSLEHQSDAGQTTLRGILFMVMAEFGYAINTTFLRRYMNTYPPLQVIGLAMSVSVALYLVVYASDLLEMHISAIPPAGWLIAAYSGLVAFFLSNVLWNLAVKRAGGTRVAVYGNLPPVIVLLLSSVIFHDRLHPMQIVGSAVVLCGVLLVQLRSPGSPAPAGESVPAATKSG